MARKGGRHNHRTGNKPYMVTVDRVKHKGNFIDGLQKAGLNLSGAVAMADDFSEANQKMRFLFATGYQGRQVVEALGRSSPRLPIPGKRWVVDDAQVQSYDKDPSTRDTKVPVPTMTKIRSSMMIAHGLKPEFEEDAEHYEPPIEDDTGVIPRRARRGFCRGHNRGSR